MGKYIYCITKGNEEKEFGEIGLGDTSAIVSSVLYKDLAAIVSESSTKKHELSRKNMIGHQKVCEEVMKDSSILPVRFATVADDEEQIVEKILEAQYEKLKGLLDEFDSKVELGLKVLWPNMDEVFEDLLCKNPDLQKIRESLLKQDPEKTYYERADFGQKIKQALEKKKKTLSMEILKDLKSLYIDFTELKLHGDKMILNAAFLVDQEDQRNFDIRMWAKMARWSHLQFKYVGPLPAYNFIEVVIDLNKGIFNSKKTKKESRSAEAQLKAEVS